MGNASSKGPFSIAILVYQRVVVSNIHDFHPYLAI